MPSTSKKQQRFFGAVMGAKEGSKKVYGSAKKASKGMSKNQIQHFLKLKKGKKKVNERFDELTNKILAEAYSAQIAKS